MGFTITDYICKLHRCGKQSANRSRKQISSVCFRCESSHSSFIPKQAAPLRQSRRHQENNKKMKVFLIPKRSARSARIPQVGWPSHQTAPTDAQIARMQLMEYIFFK